MYFLEAHGTSDVFTLLKSENLGHPLYSMRLVGIYNECSSAVNNNMYHWDWRPEGHRSAWSYKGGWHGFLVSARNSLSRRAIEFHIHSVLYCCRPAHVVRDKRYNICNFSYVCFLFCVGPKQGRE